VGQAGGVGRLQGVEQLEAELGHPADREGAVPGDQLVEGEGVGQLGGHVDDAVLDDHVVQPDQAGMVQGGRDPRLGRHPVPEPRLPVPTPDLVSTGGGAPRRRGHRGRWPARPGRAERGAVESAASSGLRRAARRRPVTWWRANDTTKRHLPQNRP
jgi:hypothetical protein